MLGYIQLGFVYQGLVFLHETTTEWYERFQTLLEDIESFQDIVIDDAHTATTRTSRPRGQPTHRRAAHLPAPPSGLFNSFCPSPSRLPTAQTPRQRWHCGPNAVPKPRPSPKRPACPRSSPSCSSPAASPTASQAHAFLNPESAHLHDPFLMLRHGRRRRPP
jgi:hypothetical protein